MWESGAVDSNPGDSTNSKVIISPGDVTNSKVIINLMDQTCVGKLLPHALQRTANISLSDKVRNFGGVEGWNLADLSAVIPKKIRNRIACIPAAFNSNKGDIIIWGNSGSGDFSVKSAYYSLQRASY
ncbi:hypothetical protein ACOSP7_005260 [Xanthoceras sorbifolium]